LQVTTSFIKVSRLSKDFLLENQTEQTSERETSEFISSFDTFEANAMLDEIAQFCKPLPTQSEQQEKVSFGKGNLTLLTKDISSRISRTGHTVLFNA
jgi:hypothetical protein